MKGNVARSRFPGWNRLVLAAILLVAALSRDASAASPPSITSQPLSQTNLFGTNTTFTITATGTSPLRYHWSFNGTNLTNSAHIAGATNSTLIISNIAAADAGPYRVVVTNFQGRATSSVATLAVLLPPGVSSIPNQRTFRGLATCAVPFTISNAAAFTLSGASSNTNLAGTNNFIFGGTGTNRTVSITPGTNFTGTTTITVTATDQFGRAANSSFLLTVGDLTEVAANLPNAYWGTVRWVDFDNDGWLDLFLSGSDTNYAPHTWLFHNNGDGTFTEVATPFLNWTLSSADWADYDNDGYLDLVLSGTYDPNSTYGYTQIFHNNGGTNFTAVTGLPTYYTQAQATWNDFDNDGRPDVLLAVGVFTMIYHNNGDGTFSPIPSLPGSYIPAAADYDNDGWLDIALPGNTVIGTPGTKLFRNTGTNAFADSGLTFPAFYGGFAAWGDYNNDGNPDLLLTGFANTPDSTLTQLFRNNGNGTFTTISNALPSLRDSIAAWGDFDNDGKLDVFMAGYGGSYLAKVLRNTGGDTFADLGTAIPGFIRGAVACGDYDNDGALDLIIMGAVGNGPPTTKLYHNDGAMPDTPPTAPAGLTVTLGRNSALLSWNTSTDAEQTGGLAYNVRIGTVTNGINVLSPNADLATGFRRVPKVGNSGYRQSFLITNLPAGKYFWSVQAIDNAYKGSLFAGEQNFTLPAPVITNQPQNLTVSSGASATFSVGATGAPPLSFQWQINGTNISGATNFSFTINPAQFTNQGAYSVVVSNPYGVIASSNATLTVLTPPSLTQQPQSQGGVVGNFIAFSTAATGTAPFNYQWYFNGTPLADNGHFIGANSNVLTIASVLKGDSGSYQLIVTNNYGFATSSIVTLSLVAPDVLVNVDFGSGTQSSKTGPAAIGQSSSDFWNFYNVGMTGLTNLVAANGAVTPAIVTVSGQGPVAPANGNPDPMYGHYLYQYNLPGNLTVTTKNLPAGTYDFFYYAGCGDYNYNLSVNGVSQSQRQVWGSGSSSTNWQEGVHYVVFRGVMLTNSVSTVQVVITYLDSACYEAVISGMQIAESYTVPTAPFFVSQPTNQNVVSGFNANFQAGAIGSPPPNCRWFFNDVPLTNNPHTAGADGFSLIISNAQAADVGNFYLVVSNLIGSATSQVAMLSVQLLPPAFSAQPANGVIPPGSNFVFSAPATGSIPISYQWFFNGAPLNDGGNVSGSMSAILSVSAATTNQTGSYFVIASNNVNTATSSVASLFVGVPPSITQQPVSETNFAGTAAAFSVTADGTATLGYQWLLNNVALAENTNRAGSAAATLTISNAQAADAGNYTVIVTNGAGSVTSAVATLTVWTPPTITTQPVGRSVPPCLPTTFSAAASGVASLPVTYQWQLNGTNIPNSTNASYTIAAVGTNDLGIYNFIASNAVGATVSANAKLTFGNVAAWGRNQSNESLPPPDLTNAFAVAGSSGASFAARPDGSVLSWGTGPITNIPAGATNVVGIASGGDTVVLRSDGTMAGWNFVPPPGGSYPVPAASNIVSVAAGYGFGFGLRAEGTLVGWGGSPFTNIPTGLNHVTAIACGVNHTLALKDDGTVVSWGNGSITNVPMNLAGVVGIAAGFSYSLALITNGTVVAWTGSADRVGNNPKAPTLPDGLTNVAAIFCGGYAQGQTVSLAVRSNGTMVAWGDNGFGETNAPPALTNLFVVSGAGAAYHAMAIVNDGSPMILRPPVGQTAYVGRDVMLRAAAVGAAPLNFQWLLNGTNVPGATNGTLFIPSIQPASAGNYQFVVSNSLNVAVSLPAPLTVISNSALTLLSQPGATNFFQGSRVTMSVTALGDGPLQYQWYFSRTNTAYAPVPGATNDMLALDPALVMQSGNYFVAVSNQFGGITSVPVRAGIFFGRGWGFLAVSNPPVNVTNAIAIATGGNADYFGHYFALGSDGKLTSWANYSPVYGETNVSALSNSFVTAIAAGYLDSLALKSDGTVYAWGFNSYNQTNPPANLNNVVAIACGDYHDLALKSDGTVVGWGNNVSGQATNNPAATNVVAIAAGSQHSLALRADGTVTGWGYSPNGQITIPPAATNVIAIAAGSQHSVALRADGTVIGWGYNSFGQVSFPTNLTNVVAISASGNHTTVLRADGTVMSFGYEYASYASNNVPWDAANVVAIASGGSHDFALLGTRAPAFTVQPWNRNVFCGAPVVVLTGKVSGAQPVNYQWWFNNAAISGATNDTLTLTNLQFTQSGAYQLIASNSYGVSPSRIAKVVVTLPFGDSLDATNFNWTSSGSALWFGQTNVTHDGVDAAQSGGIGNSQETILQTTVATNWSGAYTFWWKVSSEQFFDALEFRINGATQTSISGEADWQQVSIPVPAGTNVLQWRYSKDASGSAGQDAAWVDQFAFVPDPPVITQQPSPTNQTVNSGTTVSYTVQARGGTLNYQWWQNGTNPVGGGTSTLALYDVARAQNGMYFVTVSNTSGSVTSSNVTLKVLVPQLLATPVYSANGTFTFTSTDANGALLSPSDLTNLDAQVSTNLMNWVTLSNALTLSNGVVQLNDPGATNSPGRFYRLVEH